MFNIRKSTVCLMILLVVGSQAIFGFAPASQPKQRLRWKSATARISISRSLIAPNPNIKAGSDVNGAILRAADAWRRDVGVVIVLDEVAAESASPAGTEGDGISIISVAATPENVLMFGKNEDTAAAKTRVFYNRRSLITEADIVLNPYQQFSTDGTYGTFDLETTIKHEIGHLFGLGHSNVVGALMHDSTARNGVFGGSEIISRELSSDDISSARDLYPELVDVDCCGTISGRLNGAGRQTRTGELWAENVETGEVVSHATPSRDGSFRFGAVPKGSYRIMARLLAGKDELSIVDLGETVVDATEGRPIVKRPNRHSRNFSLFALGLNGVLGDSNVTLVPGQTYDLIVGGTGLSVGVIKISSNSPFVSVEQDLFEDIDFQNGISAISMRVTIAAEAKPGNYSIYGVSMDGSTDCIVGGITIIERRKNE